jgi:hypothetical protein
MKSSQDTVEFPKAMSPVEFRKLEESLRDHVDILQTMNAKLNNHIGQQNEYKAYIGDRIDKIEKIGLNREIEKIPSKYEMLQMDQSIKRLAADIESIRNDQLTQKELDSIKQEEADAFFKKTANDYFNKLRELDDQIRAMRDEKSVTKLESKMGILETELIDLKNKGRNITRASFITGANGGIMSQAGFAEKFDLLVEEVNQVWSFVQRSVDEQVVDAIGVIRSQEQSVREKMNEMDWLARNAEFLSPDAITKCLLAFKELYNTDQMNMKNAYISAKHTSSAVLTVIHLLEHTKQISPRDEETMSRLAILTSVLEPLLVNDMNLDKAVEARVMELLVSLLVVPQDIKDMTVYGGNDAESIKKKFPVYLKYTLRCVTSCVRSPLGVGDFAKLQTGAAQVMEFIEYVRDEEILANSAKVLRIVLRDDKHFERIAGMHNNMGNLLLDSLIKYTFSEVVIVELLAALRNFTRNPNKVPLVAKTNLSTIISLTVNPPSDKVFQLGV